MDFQIKEVKIHLKREAKGQIIYINCSTPGYYICLGQ